MTFNAKTAASAGTVGAPKRTRASSPRGRSGLTRAPSRVHSTTSTMVEAA